MRKPFAFVISSAILIILLTNSANVGQGLAVKKLPKVEYLTNSNNTHISSEFLKTQQQIIEKLHNTKPPTDHLNDTVFLQMIVRNKTRCPILNRSKRYVLNGSRWRDKNLSYKIKNYPKKLKKSDVDAEISRAFNLWSEYSFLNFTPKSNGPVHIDISFENTENDDPFDGPGKVVARSYFPNAGGDVYFDISEYWTIGKKRGINLFQTAAHEIGHALGLSHSHNKLAIMAPMYRGYDPEFKLHEDDILAIQALYGKKNLSH